VLCPRRCLLSSISSLPTLPNPPHPTPPLTRSILVPYNTLPGFWKFMYRVSPFTYFVEGILGVAVANTPVSCGPEEFQEFDPPAGQTCGDYLQAYQSYAGGSLNNPSATSNCQFCQLTNTNVFLDNFGIKYGNRWRNFGIIWVYVIVNVAAACAFYWLARVVSLLVVDWFWSRANNQPKKSGKEDSEAKADKKTSEKQEHRSEKPKMTERRSS